MFGNYSFRFIFGKVIHWGASNMPAIKMEQPNIQKTAFHLHRLTINADNASPRIYPIEPQPLITPTALDMKYLVLSRKRHALGFRGPDQNNQPQQIDAGQNH